MCEIKVQDGSWSTFLAERMPTLVDNAIKSHQKEFFKALEHASPTDFFHSLPINLPMTHQIEGVPFIARYPIDKWEENGHPYMSAEGWCEFVMRVSMNKLDTLDEVFQAAKTTRKRLRVARNATAEDDECAGLTALRVEEVRPGMVALCDSEQPAEIPLGPLPKDQYTLQLVLRLRGKDPLDSVGRSAPSSASGTPYPASKYANKQPS